MTGREQGNVCLCKESRHIAFIWKREINRAHHINTLLLDKTCQILTKTYLTCQSTLLTTYKYPNTYLWFTLMWGQKQCLWCAAFKDVSQQFKPDINWKIHPYQMQTGTQGCFFVEVEVSYISIEILSMWRSWFVAPSLFLHNSTSCSG